MQADRDGKRQTVHYAGKRRAFLGHFDKDLARTTVFVEANGDVAFVTADAELMGNGGPFRRHLFALGACEEFALHWFHNRRHGRGPATATHSRRGRCNRGQRRVT